MLARHQLFKIKKFYWYFYKHLSVMVCRIQFKMPRLLWHEWDSQTNLSSTCQKNSSSESEWQRLFCKHVEATLMTGNIWSWDCPRHPYAETLDMVSDWLSQSRLWSRASLKMMFQHQSKQTLVAWGVFLLVLLLLLIATLLISGLLGNLFNHSHHLHLHASFSIPSLCIYSHCP